MKTKVSVILPVRNEEVLIKKSLTDISRYLSRKKFSYEILTILNGCDDATESLVKKYLNEKEKNIKIYKSKPGYGYALRKGMKMAQGKYVVIFNVDFYDLSMIDLVDIDLMGKDMVIGSKMTFWADDKRPLKRRLISKFYNLLISFSLGFKGSDTHGIKIIRKDLVNKILKKCKTYSGIMDTEFVIRTQRAGYKIMDYPVKIEEKRPPRFIKRFLSTPKEIYNLYEALK